MNQPQTNDYRWSDEKPKKKEITDEGVEYTIKRATYELSKQKVKNQIEEAIG